MIRYQFPVLDTIAPLLKAIEGREEFSKHIKVTAEGARYQVLDYHVNFQDTFPEFGDDEELNRISILRRECRGLIADPDTGEVISRAWHKFHNVGERPSTQPHLVDLSQPHLVMDKLDGSMVRPFIPKNGDMLWNTYPTRPMMWGTMAGVTDVSANALAFLKTTNVDYDKFAHDMIDSGYTPIFEWCSRKNRIVVDYTSDNLVLTGIRHRRDGTYLTYDQMQKWAEPMGIPVVEVFQNDMDIDRLIAHARGLPVTHEGYVLRFNDGHMVKIKAELYCRIHKTKEHLVFEKNMVELILRKEIDDVLPDFPESDQARVRAFTDSILKTIYGRALDLQMEVNRRVGMDQKEFAKDVEAHPYKKLMFIIRKGLEDPRDILIRYVLNHSSTGPKLEQVRDLIGPKWETF